MTRLASNSPLEESILSRRKQLRGKKRLDTLIGIWRTLAIASLAGLGLWATTLPEWIIRRPNQVIVRGNKLLSTAAIQALLPLKYPQSLLELQPQLIASTLESVAPISKTTLTRQLFPPRLIVEVVERSPVAVSQCSPTEPQYRCTLIHPIPKGQPLLQGPANLWMIDSQGTAVPLASFLPPQSSLPNPSLLTPSLPNPTLRVWGLFAAAPDLADQASDRASTPISNPVKIEPHRQRDWATLYEMLRQNPVKVSEIDWRSPQNLILQTELGTVFLGPYNTQFPRQLKALDQIRKLPQLISRAQIDHIDLNNPEHPVVQMRQSKKPLPINQPAP
jgi:cell division protein FtsQ